MTAAPIAMKAVAGALCGWAVAELADRPGDPVWFSAAAATTLTVAFPAAPSVANGFGRSISGSLALATAVGIYVGVPETDHVRGLGVAFGVLALAELLGRFHADVLVTMAIDAALVWAVMDGAVGRSEALIGGLAALGLLLVAPLVIAGQRSVDRDGVAWALVALQLVCAVVVARSGATRADTGAAAAISVLGLVVLVVAARLVVSVRVP